MTIIVQVIWYVFTFEYIKNIPTSLFTIFFLGRLTAWDSRGEEQYIRETRDGVELLVFVQCVVISHFQGLSLLFSICEFDYFSVYCGVLNARVGLSLYVVNLEVGGWCEPGKWVYVDLTFNFSKMKCSSNLWILLIYNSSKSGWEEYNSPISWAQAFLAGAVLAESSSWAGLDKDFQLLFC